MSNIGTWMQLVAQSLLVLRLTGSPALTGLTVSVQAAPGLLLGLVGGALVDAWPRRLTAGACQALLGLVALLTAALAASGLLSVPVLLALSLVTGVIATVDGPAVALLGNELVPEDEIPSAIALGSLTTSAGRVLGTAAAGAVVAVAGTATAYAVNGLSFLLVAATIPFVRPVRQVDQAPAGAPVREGGLRAGFGYLLGSRAMLGLLGIGAVTAVVGRNYTLSFATLLSGPLHAGPAALGTATSVLAIGAVLGALLAARHRSASARQVARLALAGAGLQILAAYAAGVPMLLAVALPMAVAESLQDTLTGTVLQTRPPAHLRGRVYGAWQTASAGWSLVGPPLLGCLLATCGPRDGLALGGLGVAVVAVGMRQVHLRFAAPVAVSVALAA